MDQVLLLSDHFLYISLVTLLPPHGYNVAAVAPAFGNVSPLLCIELCPLKILVLKS